MPDIVQRLRDRSFSSKVRDPLVEEAADEIELMRLTEAEREAIGRGIDRLVGVEDISAHAGTADDAAACTLRGLLDRLA